MSEAAQHEHEFEAAWGLPEALPAGEKLLWQGAPDWRVLAREAMHVPLLAWYFAAMLAWRAGTVLLDGGGWAAALWSIAFLLPLALAALGMLGLLAWLVSRTSAYTITSERVVMRIGIVLTITFNLPHRQIASASLRRNKDGSGDIALVLAETDRIAYLNLWPHVRPWRIQRTEPMLRALQDSASVSGLLVEAIARSAGAGQTLVSNSAPLGNRPSRSGAASAGGPVAA